MADDPKLDFQSSKPASPVSDAATTSKSSVASVPDAPPASAPDTEKAEPEVVLVEVVLADDADVPEGADAVHVSVPNLQPNTDYTDEHGRVAISSTPVAVPADVAAELVATSPHVALADKEAKP